jgi:RND superfamily putative drug exporter
VLGGLTAAATTLHFGPATGDPNTISQRGDARAGLVALEQSGIGSGAMAPIEVLTPAAKAGPIVAELEDLSGIRGADISTHADGLAVVDAYASSNSSAAVDRVRAAAHSATRSAQVGGIVAQNDDFISATYDSFPLMLAVIAALTFLLLARALRSVFLPLKAVILNVLSLAAAWGVLALIWQHGWGSDALWGVPASSSIPSWLPLIIFAFLFGLSMDYEVFILTRVREARDEGRTTDAALVRGVGRTGRLVTSAALILLLGFLAMSTAPSTGVKMMATGLGAGIILDATVIRSLLVPAAVSLLGRWNWWMPQSLAALLRVPANPVPRPES